MKKLILSVLILMSLPAFAESYTCYVSNFKLSFQENEMMSDLVIQDRVTGEFVYSGYVDSIQKFNGQLQYNFGRFKMSFKKEDIDNKEERLSGFADGTFGRGFYNTTLPCVMKN